MQRPDIYSITEINPRPVKQSGDIATLASRYLVKLQFRQYSRNTIIAYRHDLEQFAGFLLGQGVTVVQDITSNLLEHFVEALMVGENNTARTADRKLRCIKQFIRFCITQQAINPASNPLNGLDVQLKYDTAPPDAPSADAIIKMIKGIPADSPIGIRDRALIRLLYDSALRISGVVSLDLFDAARPPRHTIWPNGTIHYLAKGGLIKTTACDAVTRGYIQQWLDVRHAFAKADNVPALFISKRGRRISRHDIHNAVKKYGRAAGMPDIHAHLLRHRRARDVLDHTGDLRMGQRLLGHSTIQTTADIYGTVTDAELRRCLQGCPVDGEAA